MDGFELAAAPKSGLRSRTAGMGCYGNRQTNTHSGAMNPRGDGKTHNALSSVREIKKKIGISNVFFFSFTVCVFRVLKWSEEAPMPSDGSLEWHWTERGGGEGGAD